MCACTCTFIPFFSCHVQNASQGSGHLIGQVITMTSSLLLFRFFLGCQCSCGRWVTPSFQVHKSKIDFKMKPKETPPTTAKQPLTN